jgi:eukaryotic-like serine/threonine-protein kinase
MLSEHEWDAAKRIFHEALEVDEAEREVYLQRACGADARLLAEVRSLLTWDAETEGFLDTPIVKRRPLLDLQPPASLQAGDLLGTWRILHLIGHGGMGAVYRAERADHAFQRPAAVKVVRRGRESTRIIERFRRERETLAALDHPNIARLLDGGSTPDGEPYVVMEYVDGVRVDRYCDEERLSIDRRIEVFLAVCAGVQYAHQNLVVHRDIKPDNILVSRDGVPKLLDFGVAKLLSTSSDEADDQTAASTWMLTPDYASPEQVAGRARVTTATDVYSLGVLLYVLLTGYRPYHLSGTSPEDLEVELGAAIFVPPSLRVLDRSPVDDEAAVARGTSREALSARLTGDLDAIVLKALSRDVPARYTTVDALMQDLERHRTHHPVSARRPTAGYLAGRFVRRHRVALAAALAVLGLTLLGTGAVWWQAREAAAARALAERRFDEVRQLARAFMFDVHDAIVNVPGTTAARGLLVQTGVQYLDRLAAEESADPGLQRELAATYVKVGDAQGHPTSPNLGDTAGARASYERAIGIASTLVAQQASDLEAARTLAMAHRRLGDVLAWAGELDTALEHTRRSAALFDAVAQRPSPSFEDRLHAGIADVKLGDLLGNASFPNLGRADEAATHYDAALVTFRRLDADAPGDRRVRRFLGLTQERIGQLHESAGRWDDALAAYETSFVIRDALAAAVPFHTDIERDLAVAYEKLGNIQRQTRQSAAALDSYRRALARFERLLIADPSNVSAIRTVGISQEKVAQALRDIGARSDAMSMLRQALEAHQTVGARDPGNVQARCDEARVREQIGDLRAETGSGVRGCADWRAVRTLQETMGAGGQATCSGSIAMERIVQKLQACR